MLLRNRRSTDPSVEVFESWRRAWCYDCDKNIFFECVFNSKGDNKRLDSDNLKTAQIMATWLLFLRRIAIRRQPDPRTTGFSKFSLSLTSVVTIHVLPLTTWWVKASSDTDVSLLVEIRSGKRWYVDRATVDEFSASVRPCPREYFRSAVTAAVNISGEHDWRNNFFSNLTNSLLCRWYGNVNSSYPCHVSNCWWRACERREHE